METVFYLSLAANVILLVAMCLLLYKRKPKNSAGYNVIEPVKASHLNPELHEISERCKKKIGPQYRNRVKLLVEQSCPELPAVLKIDNLMLSLKRHGTAQSLFDVATRRDALYMARDGYNKTARYIPVPWEAKFVVEHMHTINIYLEELGLEKLSADDEFWCVDVETGYNTGWKRFGFDVDKAFESLGARFRVYVPAKNADSDLVMETSKKTAKLFLLLKGWEYLFAEV